MTHENPTYNQKLLKASNKIAIVLSIGTIILVIITVWYAYSNHLMLNFMQSESTILNRPYLSINSMDTEEHDNEFVYWYTLANKGKTPAIITEITVTALSTTTDSQKELEHSQKHTIIHPGEVVRDDLIRISEEGVNQQFKIELVIKYKSSSQNQSIYEIKYDYLYKGDVKNPLAIINNDMK